MANRTGEPSERRHAPMLPGFKEMAARRVALARALTERRIELGLTQTDVAARMGTSQSAVARIEAGHLDVRVSTIERYAEAVGHVVAGGSRTVDADFRAPATLGDDVASRLFERRVVLLSGEVDVVAASRIAAELMTLDAVGDGQIELRLGSCGGTFEASLALIDVISVLGVSVRTLAIGSVEGGPVGVLVAGGRRAITPHGRLRLREPDGVVSGRARDLERSVAEHAAVREGFLTHVADRVGRPHTEVQDEWARTSSLEAMDAVALGYVDEVLTRDAS